jgi:DNA helicase-4
VTAGEAEPPPVRITPVLEDRPGESATFTPGGWLRRALSGARRWTAEMQSTGLLVTHRGLSEPVGYATIVAVEARTSALATTVCIARREGELRLGGLRRHDAVALVAVLRGQVAKAVEGELSAMVPGIDALGERARRFLSRECYIATSELTAWRQTWVTAPTADTLARFGQLRRHPYLDSSRTPSTCLGAHDLLEGLVSAPDRVLAQRNQAFVDRELTRRDALFDTVESRPLTDEQRWAAVVLEDRNLLVASAGSGKTSTVVAKVAYLLDAGVCGPEEILVLSFNRKVAEELTTRLGARVRGGDRVRVETFHALGLAIIGTSTGTRPAVPPWASDDTAGGTAIEGIVNDLCARDPEFARAWLLFLSLHSTPDLDLVEFEDEIDYRRYIQRVGELDRDRCGIRTLQGELVKSMQELAIANWLFVNGVEYEYERPYHHPTADSAHRQYQPDFYYPLIDLWHEHFALDELGRAPRMWPRYASDVEWKRRLHRSCGTQLIETTSAMYRAGRLFPALKDELERRELRLRPRSDEEIRARLQGLKVSMPMAFLRTFFKHMKSNRLEPGELRVRAARQRNRFRAESFLEVVQPIAAAYDRKLRDEAGVDFEDMINLAADHVAARNYASPYRVILVDEFQDISAARARLVRALLDQRSDGRLFAVGDDWQSVNRFAGSDVQLMLHFGAAFPGASTTSYLTRTFRSNQGICHVSSRFVQTNKEQLTKTVTASDPRREGVIQVVLHNGDPAVERRIHSELEAIAHDAAERARRVSVFVLARYNHLRPAALPRWQRAFRGAADIEFHTCHGVKGLEADYVFLLGCDDGVLGFPSRREDDPLLGLVMPELEGFPFAEERRLFYVALTRARHQTWVFASIQRPSGFVIELSGAEYRGEVSVEAASEVSLEFCPGCRAGVLVSRTGPYGPFVGCSTYPVCTYTRSPTGVRRR